MKEKERLDLLLTERGFFDIHFSVTCMRCQETIS